MNKRAYSPGVMEEAFTSVTTITARRIEAVEDKVIGLQQQIQGMDTRVLHMGKLVKMQHELVDGFEEEIDKIQKQVGQIKQNQENLKALTIRIQKIEQKEQEKVKMWRMIEELQSKVKFLEQEKENFGIGGIQNTEKRVLGLIDRNKQEMNERESHLLKKIKNLVMNSDNQTDQKDTILQQATERVLNAERSIQEVTKQSKLQSERMLKKINQLEKKILDYEKRDKLNKTTDTSTKRGSPPRHKSISDSIIDPEHDSIFSSFGQNSPIKRSKKKKRPQSTARTKKLPTPRFRVKQQRKTRRL